MAHLYKPQVVNYVDAEGRRVPKDAPGARKVRRVSSKWYAKGSPFPKGKQIPLAADRQAAEVMLAELVREAESGKDDLSRVAAAWPNLPPHIRAAILTLIEAATKGER